MPAPVEGEIDPQRLRTLQEMLSQQNLGALELFGALSPHLQQCLGRSAFARIREQVNNLQFGHAAEALKDLAL
jgi:hypothetical protein